MARRTGPIGATIRSARRRVRPGDPERTPAAFSRPGDWRSAVITTAKRFDLVGLTWRSAQRAGARIRVRDGASGRWSAWTAMADEHGAATGTEPVWAGGADALQLRLTRRPPGLRAHFVNTTGSATPADRALTALRRRAHDAYVALTGAPAQAQDAGGAPLMVSRAEWGADQCRPRAAPTYGSVQAAFVHHTVKTAARHCRVALP